MKEILGNNPEVFDLLSKFPILALAFTKAIRDFIFRRANGRCEYDGCNKSFFDGWLVDCAHLPDVVGLPHDHDHPRYNDPSAGKLVCLEHHLEMDRGDQAAEYLISKRIRDTFGGRTIKWIRENLLKE